MCIINIFIAFEIKRRLPGISRIFYLPREFLALTLLAACNLSIYIAYGTPN